MASFPESIESQSLEEFATELAKEIDNPDGVLFGDGPSESYEMDVRAELFVEQKNRPRVIVWAPMVLSFVCLVLIIVSLCFRKWVMVRAEAGLNEHFFDIGLFDYCQRQRVNGLTQVDKCYDELPSRIDTESLRTWLLLVIGMCMQLMAMTAFAYLVIPFCRTCCDMIGTNTGNREWRVGCGFLVCCCTIYTIALATYASDLDSLIDEQNAMAKQVDPADGYARLGYSFYLVVTATCLTFISIVFIVCEIAKQRMCPHSAADDLNEKNIDASFLAVDKQQARDEQRRLQRKKELKEKKARERRARRLRRKANAQAERAALAKRSDSSSSSSDVSSSDSSSRSFSDESSTSRSASGYYYSS